jgi:hypothetical protein
MVSLVDAAFLESSLTDEIYLMLELCQLGWDGNDHTNRQYPRGLLRVGGVRRTR